MLPITTPPGFIDVNRFISRAVGGYSIWKDVDPYTTLILKAAGCQDDNQRDMRAVTPSAGTQLRIEFRIETAQRRLEADQLIARGQSFRGVSSGFRSGSYDTQRRLRAWSQYFERHLGFRPSIN
ncbi:hypothetical protein Tco_0271644 [Tanacetum coccineum]